MFYNKITEYFNWYLREVSYMIRLAQQDDAERLLEIQQGVLKEQQHLITTIHEFFQTIEGLKAWIRLKLENKRETILVAEVDGNVVGWLVLQSQNRERLAHIGIISMMVEKEYRCRGIGEELLGALLLWAEENPFIEKVSGSVLSTNNGAIALYKKIGFSEEGRKVDEVKIHNTYIDEILLYKITRKFN